MSPSVNQPLRLQFTESENSIIKNHKDSHTEKLSVTYPQKFESTCLSQSVELEIPLLPLLRIIN